MARIANGGGMVTRASILVNSEILRKIVENGAWKEGDDTCTGEPAG
jgi:hypothetical protein